MTTFTIPISKVRLQEPGVDFDYPMAAILHEPTEPAEDDETLIAYQGRIEHSFEVKTKDLPDVIYTKTSYVMVVETDPPDKAITGRGDWFVAEGDVCSIIPESVDGAGEDGGDVTVYTVNLEVGGTAAITLSLNREQATMLRFGQRVAVKLRPAT